VGGRRLVAFVGPFESVDAMKGFSKDSVRPGLGRDRAGTRRRRAAGLGHRERGTSSPRAPRPARSCAPWSAISTARAGDARDGAGDGHPSVTASPTRSPRWRRTCAHRGRGKADGLPPRLWQRDGGERPTAWHGARRRHRVREGPRLRDRPDGHGTVRGVGRKRQGLSHMQSGTVPTSPPSWTTARGAPGGRGDGGLPRPPRSSSASPASS